MECVKAPGIKAVPVAIVKLSFIVIPAIAVLLLPFDSVRLS